MKLEKNIRYFILILLVILIGFITINYYSEVSTVELIFRNEVDLENPIQPIDIKVRINDSIIFNQTLSNTEILPLRCCSMKLKSGIHSIEVASNKGDLNAKQKFIVLASHHWIVITLEEISDPSKTEFELDIDNKFFRPIYN